MCHRLHETSEAAWVSRYYPAVWRAIWAYSGGDSRTDDAVQAAFEAAFRYRRKGKRIHNPSPWLIAVAANWIRESERNTKREFLVECSSKLSAATSSEENCPEGAALQAESDGKILEAIRELPDKQRQVVYLYFYVDASYDEISQLTATNVGTVKSRLHRAKARLRDIKGLAYLNY